MRSTKFSLACVAMLVLTAARGQAAITVHTSDFIANGSRSHFNGFESIPNDGTVFTGGAGPYIEDTIQVEQINGDAGNTFADGIAVNVLYTGFEGSHSWYPNGGDNGYSQISLAGGIDFHAVGFNYATGGSASTILYELLDSGGVVLSGSATLTEFTVNYLGFSGGGFDAIRMRDTHTGAGGSVTDGSLQALAFDNIETQGGSVSVVPEPSSLTLASIGCVVVLGAWRRHRVCKSRQMGVREGNATTRQVREAVL